MTEPQQSNQEFITLTVKWNTQEMSITLPGDSTVFVLKEKLEELTHVRAERQKLLGLTVKGKLAKDDNLLREITLKPNMKVIMMGTVDEHILQEPGSINVDVVNDLDVAEDEVILDPRDSEENKRKIQQRLEKYEIKMLNPPRQGKKLLVLDIDYTIFDMGSTVERAIDLMRPYLHEFLTAVYPYYDIMIWRWIELKMTELNVLTNHNYKITALLDYGAMITVNSSKYGVVNCKPLRVIWGKLGEYYSEKNTIMFDDLRRNFIMNPQSGLRIKAFKNAQLEGKQDEELKKLTQYLLLIKDLDDFTTLNHSKWEKYLKQHKSSN